MSAVIGHEHDHAHGHDYHPGGVMRWVNSHKLNAPLRFLFGNRVERLKERMGLGWTLMVLARKRAAEGSGPAG